MLDDLRTCRATTFLGASWIIVFVAMHIVQGPSPRGPVPLDQQLMGFGQVSVETAYRFGALRWPDVLRGEIWRPITATFIHFNALHLIMNLIGLMQLGWLMEPWYGSRQFLAICVAIGGLGNVFGGVLRQTFYSLRASIEASGIGRMMPEFLRNGGAPGQGIPVTSGGGSTIILGLLGLGVVVGWRSRTRVGTFLRDQMLGFLVFTALLGAILAKVVDNYGHAGGALAGVAVGFTHRKLVHSPEKGWFRAFLGLITILVLMGCAVAQARDARLAMARERERLAILAESSSIERRGRATQELLAILDQMTRGYEKLAFLKEPLGYPDLDWPEPLGRTAPAPPPPTAQLIQTREQARREITTALEALAGLQVPSASLDGDLRDGAIIQLSGMAERALGRPPTAREHYEFGSLARELNRAAKERQKALLEQFEALTRKVEGLRVL